MLFGPSDEMRGIRMDRMNYGEQESDFEAMRRDRLAAHEPIQIPLACVCDDFAGSHSARTGKCFGWCDQTCQEYRPVPMDRTTPAFEAIRSAANERLWPEGFASDLYRDWQSIVADPKAPKVFVWGLRRDGTEFFHPHVASLRWMEASRRSNNDKVEWYTWDGEKLNRVDYALARGFISEATKDL